MRRLTPKSYTDGKRSWLGSSLRQAWPHEKPHIYKAQKGWIVRSMSYGRVKASGPFNMLPNAFLSAKLIWDHELSYINIRARRAET